MIRLRLRALGACMREAARLGLVVGDAERGSARSQEPSTAERAAYFRTAERDRVTNLGPWAAGQVLAGKNLAWCAAAQGWAERQVAVSGEQVPPHRIGVLELVTDASNGLRGSVVTASEARAGRRFPGAGSLAIISRGPSQLHVERVVTCSPTGYLSIGANEVTTIGCWNLEWRDFSDPVVDRFLDCDPLTDDELLIAGALFGVSAPVRGYDVSVYNAAAVNWSLMERDFDFAFVRAVSGGIDDTAFDRWLQQTPEKIQLGAYAWLDQRKPAVVAGRRQWDALLEENARLSIVPALDVESLSGEPFNVAWWREALPIAIDDVQRHTGRLPYIYGPTGQLSLLGEGPWCDCPLWLAHYTTSPIPRMPPQWRRRWGVWQYAGDPAPPVLGGSAPGYGGGLATLDLNLARELEML